eukprot:3448451-Amphidinium_carterae.1
MPRKFASQLAGDGMPRKFASSMTSLLFGLSSKLGYTCVPTQAVFRPSARDQPASKRRRLISEFASITLVPMRLGAQ